MPAMLVLLALLVALMLAGCGSSAQGAGTTTTTTTQTVVPIPNSACLRCHSNFVQSTAGENKLVFSHEMHLQQQITGEALPPRINRDVKGNRIVRVIEVFIG